MKKTIPSILGILILIVGIASGVFLVGQRQIFRLGAESGNLPRDIRISNIDSFTFTVTWITEKDTVGFVSWGETPSLGQTTEEIGSKAKKIHSLTIKNLKPSTTYYFVINSAGFKFDNNGVPWSVSTAPYATPNTETVIASGVVLRGDGTPASNILVYINGGSISQLSTTTSQNGTWTIFLSNARNKTLSSYAKLDSNTILDIFVQAGNETAAAQIMALKANPVPNILLGKTYDFRSSENQEVTLPKAEVTLPQNPNQLEISGSLDVSGQAPKETQKAVTLDSISKDNELIFTSTPEFFGKGPAGTEVNIKIESNPITARVRIGSDGRWRFNPGALEDGEHTITISWRDSQGFLRSITKKFIVQAADGEPGFESTPTGRTSTTKPSPSPSPKPNPTNTPTPSLNPAPTRASIPSTESGIPAPGSLTPTLFLATIGLLLFFSGIVIIRKNS